MRASHLTSCSRESVTMILWSSSKKISIFKKIEWTDFFAMSTEYAVLSPKLDNSRNLNVLSFLGKLPVISGTGTRIKSCPLQIHLDCVVKLEHTINKVCTTGSVHRSGMVTRNL